MRFGKKYLVREVRKLTKAGRTVVVANRWTLVRDGEGDLKSILVIDTDIPKRNKWRSFSCPTNGWN
jgi:hypothetical protein